VVISRIGKNKQNFIEKRRFNKFILLQYLRRPPEKNEEFRLDRLLKRKAEEGVKIYIIVYKEMAVALTINSAHTKLWLQNLHKNIIGKFCDLCNNLGFLY
jgi:hypothetical protein